MEFKTSMRFSIIVIIVLIVFSALTYGIFKLQCEQENGSASIIATRVIVPVPTLESIDEDREENLAELERTINNMRRVSLEIEELERSLNEKE